MKGAINNYARTTGIKQKCPRQTEMHGHPSPNSQEKKLHHLFETCIIPGTIRNALHSLFFNSRNNCETVTIPFHKFGNWGYESLVTTFWNIIQVCMTQALCLTNAAMIDLRIRGPPLRSHANFPISKGVQAGTRLTAGWVLSPLCSRAPTQPSTLAHGVFHSPGATGGEGSCFPPFLRFKHLTGKQSTALHRRDIKGWISSLTHWGLMQSVTYLWARWHTKWDSCHITFDLWLP